nr:immunoglobulin heavy chain junction region [Macaca mulatta]MOY18232.1 immunoglobulin heavy chain junction region [Macaca mulatta]MOY19533.1 immunoglobulin heavy chain junction region [Macaca mulatta]MOY20165.1 immunoglobulin heavy chain junction region [Macaca mulatta]
CVQGILSW